MCLLNRGKGRQFRGQAKNQAERLPACQAASRPRQPESWRSARRAHSMQWKGLAGSQEMQWLSCSDWLVLPEPQHASSFNWVRICKRDILADWVAQL